MLEREKTKLLITGGDKGIGRGIVELFARKGHEVYFTYKSNVAGAKDIQDKYPASTSIKCDFSDQASVDLAIGRAMNLSQGINVLINNVGVDIDGIFSRMEFKDWYEVLNINLIQIYHFCHALIPSMMEGKWGRIINISSIGAFTTAFGKTNYAASKAGIIGFTKALALEVARKGITVNSICPGAIETDMFYRIPEKYREQLIAQIPVGRTGRPEEVAELAYFLCGDKASFITGQTIHVNGGQYLG